HRPLGVPPRQVPPVQALAGAPTEAARADRPARLDRGADESAEPRGALGWRRPRARRTRRRPRREGRPRSAFAAGRQLYPFDRRDPARIVALMALERRLFEALGGECAVYAYGLRLSCWADGG